jgi:hypothetical protein
MRELMSRNAVILGSAFVFAVAVAGGGYYWTTMNHSAASGKTVSLADSDICALTVDRARDYGVLPQDAKKLDIKTVDTANPNHITCGAKSAEASYALTADVVCDDAKNAECLVLQKVTHETARRCSTRRFESRTVIAEYQSRDARRPDRPVSGSTHIRANRLP